LAKKSESTKKTAANKPTQKSAEDGVAKGAKQQQNGNTEEGAQTEAAKTEAANIEEAKTEATDAQLHAQLRQSFIELEEAKRELAESQLRATRAEQKLEMVCEILRSDDDANMKVSLIEEIFKE
jgi:hypothetical protein